MEKETKSSDKALDKIDDHFNDTAILNHTDNIVNLALVEEYKKLLYKFENPIYYFSPL